MLLLKTGYVQGPYNITTMCTGKEVCAPADSNYSVVLRYFYLLTPFTLLPANGKNRGIDGFIKNFSAIKCFDKYAC